MRKPVCMVLVPRAKGTLAQVLSVLSCSQCVCPGCHQTKPYSLLPPRVDQALTHAWSHYALAEAQ